jgi:hypothetical protein
MAKGKQSSNIRSVVRDCNRSYVYPPAVNDPFKAELQSQGRLNSPLQT